MLRNFKEEVFDILIQAGQSNSEGTGYGPADRPFEPDDRIFYLNGDDTISRAAEQVSGNAVRSDFSLSFAKNYVEKGLLRDGRKLLIVRSAVGGTGFLDRRWGLRDDLFLRMIEMSKTALCLHPSNRIVGLLWHQGETDADLGADRDGHYKRLWDLVEAVRSVFGSPDLPFLAGDFVEQWRKAGPQKADPVRAAMRDVCKDAGRAAFVETDGLASNDQQLGNGDTIHFSRNALAQLGERYFEAFYQLLA